MAGATNFLQWNPTQNNQETDAQYQADSQRVGGAPVGTPWPSRTANKALYQVSTGVAALMQMMANKGFTVSDTNFGTLASVLAAIQTTADKKTPYQIVSYSPSVTLNAATTSAFQINLAGNCSITISGGASGDTILLILIQDATGNRTINVASMFPGTVVEQPNPANNIATVIQLIKGQNFWNNGAQVPLGFNPVENGTGIGQIVTNRTKIGWSGSRLKGTVDLSDLGNFVFDTQLTPVSAAAATAQSTINAFKALFVGTFNTSPGFFHIGTNGGNQMIMQWGKTGAFDTGPVTATFPLTFPNACLVAFACDLFGGSSRTVSVVSFNTSGVSIRNNGSAPGALWFAIGW